jgi:hypothetical protein
MTAHEIEVAGEGTVNDLEPVQHEVAPVSAVVAGETPSLSADTKVVLRAHACTHTHRNAHTEKEAAEEEQAAPGKTEDEEAEKIFRTLREESPPRLGRELADGRGGGAGEWVTREEAQTLTMEATEQQAREKEEDVHGHNVLHIAAAESAATAAATCLDEVLSLISEHCRMLAPSIASSGLRRLLTLRIL